MPEITRGNVSISYTDEGVGRPVLLLHGHTLDRRTWLTVVPHLLTAGLRVVRPDLRGHGQSDRPDFGYHFADHAADMIALLDHLEIERTAIIGFSFGGGVALEIALTHPDRVHALGLVASVMPDRPFEPVFMDSLREVAGAIHSKGVAAAMTETWSDSPLFAHSFSKPGVREAVTSIVAGFPGAEFLATRRDEVSRDWTVPDRLSEIAIPTAVMVGEHEMTGFRGYSDEAAGAIRGATLEVVPDCGHLLPFEAPDAVTKMIVNLFRRT